MSRPEVALNLRPEYVEPQPSFEAGSVRITHISDAPQGIQFETTGKLRRGQLRNKPFHELIPLDSELGQTVSQKTRADVDFALTKALGEIPTTLSTENENYDNAQQALHYHDTEKLKALLSPEEFEAHISEKRALEARKARVNKIHSMTDEERRKFMDIYASMHKLGIRFPQYDKETDTFKGEIVGIPYWFYKLLSEPRLGNEIVNLGAIGAGTLNLITADGKVIKQTRAKSNGKFQRDLGNSASGLQDIAFNHGEKGHAMGESDTTLKRGNLKELSEEIGIKPDVVTHGIESVGTQDILESAKDKLFAETLEQNDLDKKIVLSDFKILGTAEDPLSPHDEFLMFARINLTAQEVIDRARHARRHAKKSDRDFAEHFIVMDATPEAFEKVLTDPNFQDSPPTHAACDIVTGRYLMMEREGVGAANQWLEQLKPKMDDAWATSIAKRKEFFANHPEVVAQNPNIDLEKYDPNFDDVTNGFRPLEERILEAGIEADIERTYEKAYMFDCDGVLTDLDSQELRYTEILDRTIALLDNNAVSLCSGRPSKWIIDELLNPLIHRIDETQKSRDLLKNLVVIAESGGVIVEIDNQGELKSYKDTAHSVPTNMQDIIRTLIDVKYGNAIKFDEDKESMATAVKRREATKDEFEKARVSFMKDAELLLKQYLESGDYTMDPTAIAVDFKHKDVDKRRAAEFFVDSLRRKGISVKRFEVVGDSSSDILMAVGLEQEGKIVSYQHVGKDPIENPEQYTFPVIHRLRTNDQLMLDYLREQTSA